jgi:hypothetical protein
MISFYTFYTGGRPHYLANLLWHIAKMDKSIEHHLVLQGCQLEDCITKTMLSNTTLHEWNKNYGIGEGINKIKKKFIYPHCMKLDDDCRIYSDGNYGYFLTHIKQVIKIMPTAVFSPYPVGLINNPGGVHTSPKQHMTKYGKDTNTHYTFRKVPHIGGFARCCPTKYIKDCNFPNDLSEKASGNEDGIFSQYCNERNIPMFYLENALVVEHSESTLGQHKRYGTQYFGERF